MEQQEKAKQPWRKKKITLAILAGFVAALVVGSFLFTNQWNTIFEAVGLRDFSAVAEHAPFSMHVINVGKADAILIACNGHDMMIDGGDVKDRPIVTNYLQHFGVKKLDYVVNTHPDSDHLFGLKAVAENFPVGKFLVSPLPPAATPSSSEYTSTIQAFADDGAPEQRVAVGEIYYLNDLKIEVLGPVKTYDKTNDDSIILKLTYQNTSFLMTGDAEQIEEEDCIKAGEDLSANVLKVGHHGSDTSTCQDFLTAVHPSNAVISVGPDKNNLPKSSVLKRLASNHVTTYRTDVSGTVIVMSDGTNITVATQT